MTYQQINSNILNNHILNNHILNNYFDNIYVLYIDNDELEKITPKLKKRSIKVQFFEGVNGYKIKDRYNIYARNFGIFHKDNQNAKLLNHGSFGHILSFISILKDARMKQYKKILILEPDIYFADNFDNLCKKYLDMDYNMLYFGASQNMFYKEETWEYIEKNNDLKQGYYNAHNTLGTFALAINSNMYSECIDTLIKMEAPTDVSFIKLQNKYKDKCIVSYPNIICCDVTHSKTSMTKKQVDSMKNLRWVLKYDFEDSVILKTEVNSYYELEIDINSYFGNFTIKLFDNLNKQLLPTINTNSCKYFLHSNKLVIYFMSNSNTTILNVNHIFLDNVRIKKVNKHYIKVKVPMDLIKKIRESDIGKYYLSIILQ